MKALAGALIVALHAAAFVAIAARSTGTDLVVELAAPMSIDGHVPDAITPRVQITTVPGPGLARRTWSITYRGGFTREVGASALVGPFQDPAAPPCGGRVVVGQRVLDQLAEPMALTLDDELKGQGLVGVGDYVRVEHVQLRFAQIEVHLLDRAWVGDVPHGYIRATADIVFTRVRVPVVLAIVPERGGHFRIAARAQVELDNRVLQWVSDEVGGDKLATRLARRQIDGTIATTLAPPPPVLVSDGTELQFGYCDHDVEIAEGAYGALPFAVTIHRGDGVLPPLVPSPAFALPPPDTRLEIDVDLNGLNAMSYELWRTGWTDRRLAEAGLDRQFAADPTVAQFLSVRISPPHLALPPVITAGPAGALRLAADARLALTDGGVVTPGRVFGALDFRFDPSGAPATVELGGLELACERAPTTLVPCYADLVAALRDRGRDFQAPLTSAFAQIVTTAFVGRPIAPPNGRGQLVVDGVQMSLAAGPVLRIALDARIITK